MQTDDRTAAYSRAASPFSRRPTIRFARNSSRSQAAMEREEQVAAAAAAVGEAQHFETLMAEAQDPAPRLAATGLMEKLAASIHSQRARQLRRLQQLTARELAERERQAELAEKRQREEERLQGQRDQQQQQIAAVQRRAELAEMKRREKLAAAAQQEDELRRAAEAKLAQGSARAAAVAAERHEVAVMARVKHSVGAARKVEAVRQRATLEEAEKAAFMEQKMHRHEVALQKAAQEKRAIEAARRAEEERREAARRLALSRAEAEQAERARWLEARSRHKDSQLEARSRELGDLRALQQRQRHMRAEYARHRMELAAQQEEERRQQLTSRLAAKQQRVAVMELEKAEMLRALEEVRREIRQQEDGLKEALRLMEKSEEGPCAAELAELQRQLAILGQQPIRGASRSSSRQCSRPASRGMPPAAAEPAPLAGAVAPARAAAVQLPTNSSSGAHGSRGSPRIRAVYTEEEVAAEGGADVASHQRPHSRGASNAAGAAAAGAAGAIPESTQKALELAGFDVIEVIKRDTDDSQMLRWSDEGWTDQQEHQNGSQQDELPPATAQWQQQAAVGARAKLQSLLEAEMAREAEREELLRRVGDEVDRRRLLQFFELERQNALGLMQRLQRQMAGSR